MRIGFDSITWLGCAWFLLSGLAAASARQDPPHLSLAMDMTLASGTISARACLSRLPELHPYRFVLHRGLNIKAIRDGAGDRLRYEGDVRGRFIGEGVEYVILDTVAQNAPLCIEYVGAFPVYAVDRSDFSARDYKGAVAFNGRTVRATEQSKWYPVLYDSTLGTRAYESVTYDATVRCPDCLGIYLNGDEPKAGPEADFRSARPVPMLLFAGEFHTDRHSNLIVINGTPHQLSGRAVELLAEVVDSVRGYYEQWLGIPYGAHLVFLQHTITENNPGRHWGFVTFPTIAFSNRGFTDFVDASAGIVSPMLWPYVSHEMAHYYFGTLMKGQGPYFWFLVESLAEYIGLQSIRHFQGEAAFRDRIAVYARHAQTDTTSVPFDRIAFAGQMHERYRYEYAPLLMVALEEAVGRDAMRDILTSILRQPTRNWDYPAIRDAALAAGVTEDTWRQFETRCVLPPFANGCLPGYVSRE